MPIPATSETLTFGGAPVAFTLNRDHDNGYTVGAGIEYLFTPNWSAKAEYQYYDFGKSRFVHPAALVPFGTFNNDEHTLKAGVNYRFNLAVRPRQGTERQLAQSAGKCRLCGICAGRHFRLADSQKFRESFKSS